MQLARPGIAIHPLRFGRGRRFVSASAATAAAPAIGADLKLFATTFLAGFVFVAVFLA
jgi:hypothetical protein